MIVGTYVTLVQTHIRSVLLFKQNAAAWPIDTPKWMDKHICGRETSIYCTTWMGVQQGRRW